ncbi:ROK family protein [Streptomyces prunicolor]|uniref:ROK family protein n=1 Tax=Streptomyces prunicolor TaxID=67348 RepID=UPI00224F66D2|nr:ROK family protein [Streptomyces prunicolor]MCX5240394.1 ROK family protein [Streptomyces prunicolor]
MPDEQLGALVTVLDLVRSGTARTRPQLSQVSGLGRTVVAQRVAQLIDSELLEETSAVVSTGGRPPRELRFRAEAGQLLVAELGATALCVGIADLAGTILVEHEETADIAAGPEAVLGRVEELFDGLLAARPSGGPPVWGVGIGVPGPVEFAAGRPMAPPIMPGWDGYPVRERFADRYDAPAWVDNDVNLMALGELRVGLAMDAADAVFLKIGSGIGAGLISAGHLHRGSQGAAGDVGHVAVVDDTSAVCRCGNTGCLEAVAGGAALGRQATEAARAGESRFLADRLTGPEPLHVADVVDAAAHGDPYAVELLVRSGQFIGRTLATLVNFYNPSLVVIGGSVAEAGDLFLAAIRQTVYRRSLPLATRDLRIVRSSLGERAGLHGAAFVVIDELFSPDRLAEWINHGAPAGLPGLTGPRPTG